MSYTVINTVASSLLLGSNTVYQCDWPFYRPDDVPNLYLIRTLSQDVATAWPPDALDKPCPPEFHKQLHDLVSRDFLPLGNVPPENRSLICV